MAGPRAGPAFFRFAPGPPGVLGCVMISGVPVFLVVVLVMSAAMVLAFLVARQAGRQMEVRLTAVADSLGLRLQLNRVLGIPANPRLEGTLHGRAVRLWAYTTGSGKSRTHWAAAGVRPRRDSGLTFRFSRQGLLTKLTEFFGAKEITVGDPRFDAAWFVQTNQPEFLAAALLPEIREKLMTLHRESAAGNLQLEKGEVTYAERGQLGEAARLRRLVEILPLLHDLADVAEVAAGPGR